MMLRWVAAGVLEAAKGCRLLKGRADMPQLIAALRARDQRLGLGDATEVLAGRVESHPSRRRIPTAAGTSPMSSPFNHGLLGAEEQYEGIMLMHLTQS